MLQRQRPRRASKPRPRLESPKVPALPAPPNGNGERPTLDGRGRPIRVGSIVYEPQAESWGRVVAATDGVLLFRAFDGSEVENKAGGSTLCADGQDCFVADAAPASREDIAESLGPVSCAALSLVAQLAALEAAVGMAESGGGAEDLEASKHISNAIDELWSLARTNMAPAPASLALADALKDGVV